MSIFAVLSLTDNKKLEEIIVEKFPTNHYKITSTQWIVSSKETAKQLSDTLGITVDGKGLGPTGSGIILGISSYWGRAHTDIWEWMKVKMEEGDG